MTAANRLDLETSATRDRWRMSDDELKSHAESCGLARDLIKVQDDNAPDCVTVTIGTPDGRSIRRIVPRESWNEPAYRSSLIRNMTLLLA